MSTQPQFTMPRDLSGYSDLEAAMLAAVWAAGLPEPVAEYPFARCCPHPKRDHHPARWSTAHGSREPECVACDTWGAVSPMHEYRKGRAWRFDLAWPEVRVAVECEGGTWSGGRHTRGAGFAADCAKYNAAVVAGWRVLRFTGEQIESGEAIETVLAVMGVGCE